MWGTNVALATSRKCHERDTRNVACANDTERRGSYSRFMTNRTGREHIMKRTAIILGIAAAMGVAPSVAAAGSVTAQLLAEGRA